MFSLHIKNYPVKMKLGVYDEETDHGTTVMLNVKCQYEALHLEDDLKNTCDYSLMVLEIDRTLTHKKYRLIESVVNIVGEQLLKVFPQINFIHVEAEKNSFPGDVLRTGTVIIAKQFNRL